MTERLPDCVHVLQQGYIAQITERGSNLIRTFRLEKDGSLTEIYPGAPAPAPAPVGEP